MLLRAFTKREKLLLLVLAFVLLAGVYILGVHHPVRDSLEELAAQKASLELDYQIAQIQYDKYESMKQELEEILSLPANEITLMPSYDNLQPLMNRLNQIFALSTSYELTFDPVAVDGTTARRVIRMNFTCPNYGSTRAILDQLSHTGWRCLISDLALSTPQNVGSLSNSPVIASATITFFEQIP